jgi:DNA segregation ATPase FtsK/SpoIIIE, S-DNA-T family
VSTSTLEEHPAGYRIVRRPARVLPPSPTPGIRTLPPLPAAPAAPGAGQTAMQALLPVMGGLGMVLFVVANGNPLFLLAGVVLVAGTLGGAAAMLLGQRSVARRHIRMARERYLAHLEGERDLLRAAARQQADHAAHIHPHPGALRGLVDEPGRLWSRRAADPDFLQLRVGLGTVPRAVRAALPAISNPLDPRDPVCQRAAELLVEQHSDLRNQPVVVPVSAAETLTVVGEPPGVRRVARLLVAQLAVLHSPDEVRLAICCPQEAAPRWAAAKWLPHCLDGQARDGSSPRRLVADSLDGLRAELAQVWEAGLEQAARARRLGGTATPTQRVVVVVDETDRSQPATLAAGEVGVGLSELGVTVIRLVRCRDEEPGQVDVRVVITGDVVTVERPEGSEEPRVAGTLDSFGPAALEVLARALAPLRLGAEAVPEQPLAATTDLPSLLGVTDPSGYDIATMWRRREPRELLRVPVGVRPDGGPLLLDLKEAAHGGMGPHGLCVGATGSGKSELLRTLILALAMTHPPERLSLVLVDYKGGATFAGMERLPHTAGLITNLSEDLGLVDRMHDALFGEMRRRQRVLLEAGNVPDITEYERRRRQGQPLAPLPSLLLVVDEFSELLTSRPDFIELFVAVGRIGRSIGMHLLLASQRLEEGRLRGLESFLSYRIGLRTFNAQESRAVLGVPDAYELPPLPGSGFLKVDTTLFERFKAAFVSGAATRRTEAPVAAATICEPFQLFNREPEPPAGAGEAGGPPQTATPVGHSLLEVVVGRLAETGTAAHQVWLPPLPAALPLDVATGASLPFGGAPPVPGPMTHGPGRGPQPPGEGFGRLRVPVGLLDLPAQQRQEPLMLDLAGATGHLAVLGAPQTGKSGLLRTLVTAAALTHDPGEVAFHCIDLGGGSLAALAELPHVGTVCGRLDPDRLRRTVHEVAGLLDERERLFSDRGIDSAETMRHLWRSGALPELPDADVFLVVDNYLAVKQDYEDLADVLTDIAHRGLAYGVHLVLTAPRWHDLRPALQTSIGGRLELRLSDPLDSIIDRKLASNIRAGQPGRCLTSDKLLAQVALPRVDGRDTLDDLQEALVGLGQKISGAWPGSGVSPVRVLPTCLAYPDLEPDGAAVHGIPVGLGERDLRPVGLDLLGEDTHVLVFGDQGCGKTSFLRAVVRGCVDRHGDDELVFAVVDPRRSLLDFVPDAYLGAYAPTSQAAAGLAQSLAHELRKRLPSDRLTPAELRQRSWWSGPQIVVLVDDLDLVGGDGRSPLAPLQEYLPQARDLGLHVVAARHSGGVGRALFEPFLQRLRELGATGLVMRGDRQEGQLWPGVYPSLLPAGRGQLVRRGQRPTLIQVAYVPATRDREGREHHAAGAAT